MPVIWKNLKVVLGLSADLNAEEKSDSRVKVS